VRELSIKLTGFSAQGSELAAGHFGAANFR
jgi:hypothetical protein